MQIKSIQTRSATVLIDGNTVLKKYNVRNSKDYQRECAWFARLGSKPYLPAVLACSDNEMSITTHYAGEPISRENAPVDWKDQLNEIICDLRSADCHHGDLTPPNILVRNGRLSVIDLGQASTLDAVGQTKKRTLADDYAVSRLDCLLQGITPGAEVHVFVVWDRKETAPLERAIGERLEIIDKVFLSPLIYNDHFTDRAVWVKHFYDVRHLSGSKKGNVPFTALIVLSKNPDYVARRRIFASESRTVNVEVFDIKNELRKGREGYLHSSDNQEEARRNLRYLSFDQGGMPFKYINIARPHFETVTEAFEALNKLDGVRYVLLRKPSEGASGRGEDYDILCDDYFAVKRALGGFAYKTHSKKLFSNAGAPVDEGGFKVANKVSIGGEEVPFDIRYVGDGYFPAAWQRAILDHRTKSNGIYVCTAEHGYYATAYHALFHKAALPEKYATYFGAAFGLSDRSQIAARLRAQVLEYLKAHSYPVTRPKDITMPFAPPVKTGFAVKRELYFIRREFEQGNAAGGSKVLLNFVRCYGVDFRTFPALLAICTRHSAAFARETAVRFAGRVRRQLSRVKRRLVHSRSPVRTYRTN